MSNIVMRALGENMAEARGEKLDPLSQTMVVPRGVKWQCFNWPISVLSLTIAGQQSAISLFSVRTKTA